ncbi:CRISPR-associated protein, Csy3 family [Lampropedia hyalina DSM 16112]|jgi:CRISPR-associated protein Csy3|uniref:CRISPR-associated protein, Csy3 family n=1 Tax=Lampropedia hyalina DSM 16112 TaxID=1122156 RepID=A0A1M4XZ18_9BURK|nr:type I-F CRISPR-associated protein Csy3 [Lampropedia hyalina]SHE98741.1 CRISPR-associated protein, Csy3 family [Lampropedia hyalina DSM 16112]
MSLKTASVLAFERKLDPSDALFHAGQWQDQANAHRWPPIAIREKSVRGTISNRLKTKEQDPAKLDAAIQNPNLQTVDVAALPADADTLRVQFTLRVLPGTGKPSACNNADYQNKLAQTVQTYVQSHGFGELAQRYAHNLVNGRFLWRNRIGAEQIQITVARLEQGQPTQSWTFDALQWSLRHFQAADAQPTDRDALAALIAQGLAGSQHVLLQITALVRVGAGQEVFPSQELILDRGRGTKSKTLYAVNDVAAIHSQKIGNAIRSIDDWYEGAAEFGPIAVEPYGSVTTQGKAYRQPKQKKDFYTLLDHWVLEDEQPALEQQHFVIATLIRGGVFGEAGN